MKSLLLVGGGGHCKACIDVIEVAKMYQIKGLVQPKRSSETVLGYPVIGSDDDLPQLVNSFKSVLITVGQIKDPAPRIRLFNLVKRLGAELPVVYSSRAYCSKHAVVGEGSVIMHGAIINACAQIGNNCIINSQALVEHDVKIGDHCHISTGTRVNGNVTVGSGAFIGSGVVIKEGVKVGKNVVIGAGQTVLCDVPNYMVMKNDE